MTTFLQQQLPSCTGNHFSAAVSTTPALVTTPLQKQLPVLHRRPPSCTSSHQFCTSDYQSWTSNCLPAPAMTFLHQQIPVATSSAPATTSPEPATTFLHQQIPAIISSSPATTSPEPATTFLHQQIPAATSSAPVEISPALATTYTTNTSIVPAIQTCSNDHHPATAFAEFVVNHLYFKSLQGQVYLSSLFNIYNVGVAYPLDRNILSDQTIFFKLKDMLHQQYILHHFSYRILTPFKKYFYI